MIADMFVWALDHPPPAVYLLIYGDIDFSNTLHLLQMRMYTFFWPNLPMLLSLSHEKAKPTNLGMTHLYNF
jgi:hypothetical protein